MGRGRELRAEKVVNQTEPTFAECIFCATLQVFLPSGNSQACGREREFNRQTAE